ncbi:Por secretion system C-terminal sorting domain-containing protein [Neolewinella agarilytica]|uniref:Por secretion system C-terminal sorting domain-containing protein n=1 Tax=Neolewinella agarilytica TaxID=478744 RepID=A0A1H9AFT2_9BACT|nr:Por secretion system C-terminal sorting domain-containing protein [Neolewinella agarilytica]
MPLVFLSSVFIGLTHKQRGLLARLSLLVLRLSIFLITLGTLHAQCEVGQTSQIFIAAGRTTQLFTVPVGVTSLTVTAVGADGGNAGANLGGSGAIATSTFSVSPGQKFQIAVGIAGGQVRGGGGGGSGIRTLENGLNGLILIVAGGGGGAGGGEGALGGGGGTEFGIGAGGTGGTFNMPGGGAGGGGGGFEWGNDGSFGGDFGFGGRGGFPRDDRFGGNSLGGLGGLGGSGGAGGDGGSGVGGGGGGNRGGGGGGGYSGGDGGDLIDGFGHGGIGGSSFTNASSTNSSITPGADGGSMNMDGSVTICYTPAVALPVTMTYFRSSPQTKHIQLEWATASEAHNEGFEVQRSIDGSSFVNLGWVNGGGTANEEQTYQFTDDEVQANTTYFYRLQQVDLDGTAAFSQVVSAMITDGDLAQVSEFFPNPVGKETGVASFRINMPETGQMAIQLIDAQGRLVKEWSQEYAAGQSVFSVPIRDVRAGQYFAKMQLGKEVVYRKLVVN